MENQNPFPVPDKHKGREIPLRLLYHKTAEVERVTIEEASQIYYINLEIKTLQLELAKLEESRTYHRPITISDMPKRNMEV